MQTTITIFTLALFFLATHQASSQEVSTNQIEYKYTPDGNAKCMLPKEDLQELNAQETVLELSDITTIERTKVYKRRKYYISTRFPFVHKRRFRSIGTPSF